MTKPEIENVSEIDYYDLVRIVPTHGSAFHLPAPFFLRSQRRINFIFELPIAEETRGYDYYSCPSCGEESFFSGPCARCQNIIESPAYRNHEALKSASKKEFLRRLDQGIPDLGIVRAEFVIADMNTIYPPCPEEKPSIVQVEGSDEVRRQVDGVWQHKHEGYDYWHPMARFHKEE